MKTQLNQSLKIFCIFSLLPFFLFQSKSLSQTLLSERSGPIAQEISDLFSKYTDSIMLDIRTRFDKYGEVDNTGLKISDFFVCNVSVNENAISTLVFGESLGWLWGPEVEMSCNLDRNYGYVFSWKKARPDGKVVLAELQIGNSGQSFIFGGGLFPDTMDFSTTPCQILEKMDRQLFISYSERDFDSGFYIFHDRMTYPGPDFRKFDINRLRFPNCGEFRDIFKFVPVSGKRD